MDINITAALIGATVAGIAAPAGNAIWRKLSGNQYMTKTDCTRHHEQMKHDCDDCKASTKASICAIQHSHDDSKNEITKLRKLLIIIAMHNKVPTNKLEEFL